MDYERYYLDLLDMMNSSFKKIASGNYDNKDVERLFELSKTDRYPGIFTEMAESFGMMMVKVEAREFKLKQTIEELEKTKNDWQFFITVVFNWINSILTWISSHWINSTSWIFNFCVYTIK